MQHSQQQRLDSIKQLTLAKIEAQHSIPELEDAKDGWPLEMWYQSIRKKRLGELTVEDICKACRQQVFPEQIVPLAVEALRANPQAGELYDGELIVALKSVPEAHWKANPEQSKTVSDILNEIPNELNEDVQKEAKWLLGKLEFVKQ